MAKKAVRIIFTTGGQHAIEQVSLILNTSFYRNAKGLDWYASPDQLQRLYKLQGVSVELLQKLPQGTRKW